MKFNFSITLIYISLIFIKTKDNIKNDDSISQINEILELLQIENKEEFTKKECELILKNYLDEKNNKEKDDDDDDNNNDELNQLDITSKVIKKIIGNLKNTISKQELFKILNDNNLYDIEQDILNNEIYDNDDDETFKNKKKKRIDDDDDNDDDDNDSNNGNDDL